MEKRQNLKMSEKNQNTIDEVLNSIDTDALGDIMVYKAEYLQMQFGYNNIILFEITLEDLINENFHDLKELNTIEYGDWDSLKNWVSETEVERIKKQFDEDLVCKIEDLSEGETFECSQIYSSFLYCNGEFVWSGTA